MASHACASGEGGSLEGKRLLVIFGSYRSKRHIYERARELGVCLVILDGPRHWAAGGEAKGLVERFLAVDLAPLPSFVERAVAAMHSTGLAFDGVGTIDEFAGGFTARIAQILGLPFHEVAAADLARDKHRARQACASAGIAGPRFARIESAPDLEMAAEEVGFPAVLKPVSGVGSVQAYKVGGKDELKRRYQGIISAIGTRVQAGSGLSSDRDWFDLMWSETPALTLESWIEGPKYDVDALLDEGEVIYAHATDDLDPCGLRDVRRVAPAGLDEAAEAELVDHAAACVRALGFRRGAFNIEVKRTKQGPRMIEVNGRLGGYSTTDIHKEVWGVDLVEQWLRASLNLKLGPMEHKPNCYVAESLLPSPRSGVLEHDGFLDRVHTSPGLVAARPWVFKGEAVEGIETGAPDWLGAVLTRGKTRADALSRLDEAVERLDPSVISRAESA